MRLFTEVGYAIYDNSKLYKAETIGLIHNRAITTTTIKLFVKKGLEKDKKGFKINIISKQMMSEEEAFNRYGNNLINIDTSRRIW